MFDFFYVCCCVVFVFCILSRSHPNPSNNVKKTTHCPMESLRNCKLTTITITTNTQHKRHSLFRGCVFVCASVFVCIAHITKGGASLQDRHASEFDAFVRMAYILIAYCVWHVKNFPPRVWRTRAVPHVRTDCGRRIDWTHGKWCDRDSSQANYSSSTKHATQHNTNTQAHTARMASVPESNSSRWKFGAHWRQESRR